MSAEIANGEPVAGTEPHVAVPLLLHLYGPPLYTLALRICRGPDDAEDLLQEVFLIAIRKWKQYTGLASPRAWLFTIAARACQRRHRRRSGEPVRVASLDELLPFEETMVASFDNEQSGISAHATLNENLESLQEAIAGLPDSHRMPLLLKDIVGLSIDEVAGILGLKPGTVKARLHRTRLLLRKSLLHTLPMRNADPPRFDRQTCLDLLKAKQEALDRGAAFRLNDQLICERCRAFIATLDLTHALCKQLAAGVMPLGVQTQLLARLETELRH